MKTPQTKQYYLINYESKNMSQRNKINGNQNTICLGFRLNLNEAREKWRSPNTYAIQIINVNPFIKSIISVSLNETIREQSKHTPNRKKEIVKIMYN